MGVWGFIAQSRLNFPQRRNSRIIRVFTLTRRQSCLLTFVPQGVQVPHIDSWYAPNMYPDVYRRIYIDWFQHTNCYCCTYVYMIYIYLSLSLCRFIYMYLQAGFGPSSRKSLVKNPPVRLALSVERFSSSNLGISYVDINMFYIKHLYISCIYIYIYI